MERKYKKKARKQQKRSLSPAHSAQLNYRYTLLIRRRFDFSGKWKYSRAHKHLHTHKTCCGIEIFQDSGQQVQNLESFQTLWWENQTNWDQNVNAVKTESLKCVKRHLWLHYYACLSSLMVVSPPQPGPVVAIRSTTNTPSKLVSNGSF
jgi:hypothetical protein